MSINLLSIVLVWSDEKQRYVQKSKTVNPNLKGDVEKLEREMKCRAKS